MSNLLPNDPIRWGPPAWEFLYCVAFSYPHKPTKDERKSMHKFLKHLSNILPCPSCRKNYQARVKNISPEKHLRSKRALVKWVMKLKNEIARQHNGRLDTYDELCRKYQLDKIQH